MSESIRVPRVVPGTRPELAEIEHRIKSERGEIFVLYQVLLNSAPLAAGWEAMLTAIRNRSSVPAHLRELMILRVAILNEATFEFSAHLPYARRAGVAAEKIEAVRQAAIPDVFTEDERVVLALTDAMTRDIVVPDAVFEPLRSRFDARTIVEIVATVAAYNMVSRFLVALNIAH
jgi:alkylhydroperoxidase family enzyme